MRALYFAGGIACGADGRPLDPPCDLRASDFCVDVEAGTGVGGAETGLRCAWGVGGVVACGVEGADTAVVGEVEEGVYLCRGVVFGDFVYG